MDSVLDKIEGFVKRAFDYFDGIEFFIVSTIAGLVIIGLPIALVIRAVNQGHIWKAIAIILVFCLCIYFCIRDYRRKKFSWISIIVAAVWFMLMLVISTIL